MRKHDGFLGVSLSKNSTARRFFFLFSLWAFPPFVSIPIFRAILIVLFGNPQSTSILAFSSILFARFWLDIPLMTLLSLANFHSLSPSLEESMKVEGAGLTDRFFSLFLENSKSNLSGYLCFMWLSQLRDLYVPLMITEGRPLVVSGFTPYGIAGLTTTFGFFLKKNYTDLSFFQPSSVILVQNLTITATLVCAFWLLNTLLKNPHKAFWIWWVCECVWTFSGAWFLLLPLIFFSNWKRTECIWICVFYMLFICAFEATFSPFLVVLLLYNLLFLLKSGKLLKIIAFIFQTILCIGWCVVSLISVFFLVWLSFSENNYLPMFPFVEDFFSSAVLKNYTTIFQTGFSLNLRNSLFLGLTSGILGVFLFAFAAYAASKKRLLQGMGNGLISLTVVLTGINTMLPFVLTLDYFGLLNRYFPVIVTILNQSAPIAFTACLLAFKSLNSDYMESAQVDGATRWKAFWLILLPLSLPTLSVVFLLLFVNAWSSFMAPLLLISKPELFPVSLRLYDLAGDLTLSYTHWGLFAAGACITLGVMLFASIPLPRLFFRRWTAE